MKPIKGLYLNSVLDDVPEGYVAFARNALLNYKDGSVIKEKGFLDLGLELPYTYIGKIETATETFLFSTDNTSSAISSFKDGQLNTIIDDKYNSNFKFNFNTSKWIKGQGLKNYKDQWILIWIDLINPIRCINTTNPLVQVADDLLLFPQFNNPLLEFTVQQGGSLDRGTYIPFIQYIHADYTYTDFLPVGKPIFIGEKVKKDITSKQINFKLTNLDPDYKFYRLGFYFIQDGVEKALVSDKLSYNRNWSLSSSSQLQSISVEELLINAPYYQSAKAITQYEDRLVLLGVEEPTEIDYQKWANNIKIKVHSQLLDKIAIENSCSFNTTSNVLENVEYGSGNYRTFIHDEVYAFYISLVLTNGRKTKAFHIPGREPNNIDINLSSIDSCYKVYQVENTCQVIDQTSGTITTGIWLNQDEYYPENFGLTGKVRHHKMPSIEYCKNVLYLSSKEYQVSVLDRLGISVENVEIPEELKDQIVGYEIYYAKRSYENQTFFGQSLLLKSAVERNSDSKVLRSTGGNFTSIWKGESNDLMLSDNNLRLHSFDIEFFKPFITNPLLKPLIRLKSTLKKEEYLKADKDQIIGIWDYTLNSTIVNGITLDQKYLKVFKTTYLPNNAYLSNYDNRVLESTLLVETEKSISTEEAGNARLGDAIYTAQLNETFVAGIFVIKNNLYTNFYEQELVYTGNIQTGYKSDVLFVGDGFIGNHSFITYGLRESNDLNPAEGNRYLYRFLAESNANIVMRFEEEGDIYTKIYPQSDGTFLKDLLRNQNPVIAYNKEYNRVYDINKISPFNPYEDKDIITDHTHRGIISAEQTKEKGQRSYKTFYPLDYFEIPKSKGKIIDAHTFDRRIVVQTENSMFINLDINRLDNDDQIFVKSLNITEQTFVELLDDEKGVIGTKNGFSSAVTPIGLILVDSESKNIYLYKNDLKKLNGTVNLFLKDYIDIGLDDTGFYKQTGYSISFDPQLNNLLVTQKSSKPFTLSYNSDLQNWCSFHDYLPDDYIYQRTQLYSIKNNKLYKHNNGNYGKYYDKQVKPFYIDAVVRNEKSFSLSNVSWISRTDEEFKTFSHLTVYNNYQCTGKVKLYQASWDNSNIRKTKSHFYFDLIRNELNFRGLTFLTSEIFFKEVIDTQFGNKMWYDKEEFNSNVVVIRLEDDNSTNKAISLIQVDVTIEPSER